MCNAISMLYARKTDDGRLQTLHDHCHQVAQEASHTGERIGLANLLMLCGLLHDLGKASSTFQAYVHGVLTADARSPSA